MTRQEIYDEAIDQIADWVGFKPEGFLISLKNEYVGKQCNNLEGVLRQLFLVGQNYGIMAVYRISSSDINWLYLDLPAKFLNQVVYKILCLDEE